LETFLNIDAQAQPPFTLDTGAPHETFGLAWDQKFGTFDRSIMSNTMAEPKNISIIAHWAA
jgi:hypothetical protein